jgi:hypothetical protein
MLADPQFWQESIADRQSQLAAHVPNTGSWDMITVNETGPHKGRYLFTVFETSQPGVQRHDLVTGETETLWHAPATGLGYRSFDATFWTPWGTLITAEENWTTAAAGSNSPYGRLFELKNPVDAPGITGPLTASSNEGADFVHQNIIPRVSHEGIQFDKARNMYFIDELDGGNIYKYTSAASFGDLMSGKQDYFAAGQTFVLRVGNGNVANATGSFSWIPITDKAGRAWPGALTITDLNGVRSVDGRNTTNLAAFKGTDYMRPEDMQMQTISGADYLYFTTTTTHEIYRVDLRGSTISVFADRNTIDLVTGLPVGNGLTNPDNLAIDHDGNIYIIEDRNGGVDDDIWFAKDLNKDGDLTDEGEGLALGQQRHARIRVHRHVFRSHQQAPGLGEHPAPNQRQRSDHPDHNSLEGVTESVTRMSQDNPSAPAGATVERRTGDQVAGAMLGGLVDDVRFSIELQFTYILLLLAVGSGWGSGCHT